MKHIFILKRLMFYLIPYWGKLLTLVLLSLIGVLFLVSKPLPIKIIIDNVLLKHELPKVVIQFLSANNFSLEYNNLLTYSLVIMAFITIGGILINYISFLMTSEIGIRLVYDLSLDLYKKFQALSLTFYSKNQIGDLLQRFNGDVFVVYLLVAQIVLPIITSLLALGGMFYVMMLIDQTLALIAIAVVPILVVILLAVHKPMNETTMDQYSKQGELAAFVQQSLTSMRVIQAFVRENYMLNKLTVRAENFKKAYFKAITLSEGYNQSMALVTGIASILLVAVGASKGLKGNISPGDLYVFLGYIAAFYGPVVSLATAAGATVAFSARAHRIYEILDSDEEIPEHEGAYEFKVEHSSITFRNVDFGYNRFSPEENLVLNKINFTSNPGEVTAIIGTTGAGKTSLISLLGRFHDPWSGSIQIGGEDINSFKIKSLRENISMVLQDPILFPVSIAENIRFGNPDATMEQIINAAKLSEAHEFITKLSNGYNTIVSESGLTLSGGEKQRLSLARAFIMNTPIIVLDEPTSSVDALTEARIFKRLKNYYKDKTVIVISHRLSTIKNADQILVLGNGKISEQGTHKQLINEEKLYYNLYTQQTLD